MEGFGLSKLKQIVEVGGKELEQEDRYIAGCFARNRAYSSHGQNWFPGIYHMDEERYYQRVLARPLLASFPYRIEFEEPSPEGPIDLALYSNDADEPFALGEMKRCMEAGFENDANRVNNDVKKLRRVAPATCGLFEIVFTQCPSNTVSEYVAELARHIQIPIQQSCLYSFRTEAHWAGDQQSNYEFGIVGFLLRERIEAKP